MAPLPQENTTPSGIILAERYKPEQQVYRVLAVGSKVQDIKAGERILIDQYAIKSKVEAGQSADGADQFIIDTTAVCLAFA